MFEGVSGMFQGCFKEILRMLPENLKEVLRVYQESFNSVPGKF